MPVHKSAMGKQVDMGALIKKNEKVRAVGNMSVNARGDTIDSHGRVIKPITEKVNDQYAKTVGNRSAQAAANTNKRLEQNSSDFYNSSSMLTEDKLLTELEKELESNLEDDLEIEKIKMKEKNKNGRD